MGGSIRHGVTRTERSGATYDRPHVRLGARELGEDVLDEELLHVALHVGVAHDERTERRGHVQRAEALRACGLPRRPSVLCSNFAGWNGDRTIAGRG